MIQQWGRTRLKAIELRGSKKYVEHSKSKMKTTYTK